MAKMIAHGVFGKFRAEIYPNEDREGVNCYISAGRAYSSLAKAEDFGTIGESDEPGGEVRIGEAMLDKIRAFAESHGY